MRRGKDQTGSPDNEVYAVVTPIDGSNVVVGGPSPTVNSVTTNTSPPINGGDWFGISQPIYVGRNPASLTINVALWEEDEGNKEEAKEAVQNAVRKTAPLVALAAGVATGNPTQFLALAPEVEKITKSVAELVSNVLDLKDDEIDTGTLYLTYDLLHGNPPPINPPTTTVQGVTRGTPITIGNGPKRGIFRVHFFWETRLATHTE